MAKSNVGEAILMSTIIFCILYFDIPAFGIAILIPIFLLPLFTWTTLDEKTREISNSFAYEESRLKNEKLSIEIEKLKKELKE